MQRHDLNPSDIELLVEKIIGSVLLLRGGTTDSNGTSLKPFWFYRLELHTPSGQCIITPLYDGNTKLMSNVIFNERLQRKGMLN